jgi:hypothetical protein
MVRYRASFRKVAHYRVRLLRDLVDELSDGAECNFRNCLAEYFRAIWFWLNLMKRGRELSNRTHTSALIATSSVMAPLLTLSNQQHLPLFCHKMAASPKVSQNPNNSESYSHDRSGSATTATGKNNLRCQKAGPATTCPAERSG